MTWKVTEGHQIAAIPRAKYEISKYEVPVVFIGPTISKISKVIQTCEGTII